MGHFYGAVGGKEEHDLYEGKKAPPGSTVYIGNFKGGGEESSRIGYFVNISEERY